MSSNARLCDVFEMLVDRLDRIEAKVDRAEAKVDAQRLVQKHADDLAPAGAVILGVLHCGQPLEIKKLYDGKACWDQVVVAVVDDIHMRGLDGVFEGISARDVTSRWRADLIEEWGQTKVDAVVSAAVRTSDGKDKWYHVKCDEVGMSDSDHRILCSEIIETVVRRRIPEVCAVGWSHLGWSVLYEKTDEAATLEDVMRVVCGALEELGCSDLAGRVTLRVEPARYGQLVSAVLRDHRLGEAWDALHGTDRDALWERPRHLLGAVLDEDVLDACKRESATA